eukprot:gnl/TRDRNA2_/TRDRNA2_119582_c0_seq1.p2 gnl/TRDRNA2_/TRDRNA2_119582_c0~~gnl/TRDRNA2_/TRDRNA2_119582_c0_seq1.p2  ORF type:complete len:108 (-),score=10.59 gnl/TRDRNA2_/TRDRNA2_119582_c0_seq1:54-377(-)
MNRLIIDPGVQLHADRLIIREISLRRLANVYWLGMDASLAQRSQALGTLSVFLNHQFAHYLHSNKWHPSNADGSSNQCAHQKRKDNEICKDVENLGAEADVEVAKLQ